MRKNILKSLLCMAIGVAVTATAPTISEAGPREQAKRMHDRLAGVPPDGATLDAMEAALINNDVIGAANIAMQNPHFYSSAIKNFAAPWTNVDQTVFTDLNDFTATVVGIVRDDRPFTDALTADLVYVGAPGVVPTAYSHTDNNHYIELEQNRVDLADPNAFIPVAQSSLPGAQLDGANTAGVLTSRAAGLAYLDMGTNRRLWRYTAMNFLCRDMEELNDITRTADRVRQDVTRSPGGDSRIYHNTCVGCHNGMDPLSGAFAYLDWDNEMERTIFTPGMVRPKYFNGETTFPFGFVTIDDRWDNYWRNGPNANLGWRAAESGGFGPKGLGTEIAMSRAFSECKVEQVFERICLRTPRDPAERAEVARIADVFEAQNYSMRRVFAEVSGYCRGQ